MKRPSGLKTLGATLIITGTAVGAGMLAIPLVTAVLGFSVSVIMLVICYIFMTFTALLIAEVNTHSKEHASFHSMSGKTLGRVGQIITWISILLLLYSLTAAYMTGGSSVLGAAYQHITGKTLPSFVSTLLFTIVLGTIVISGTKTVDYANRFLITIKGLSFFLMIILFIPHVHVSQLLTTTKISKYWLLNLPVLITSFGFHTVIPSMRDYLDNDEKKLRKTIIIGSTIPLIVYILWEIVIIGIIPLHGPNSFDSIAAKHGSVGEMILVLNAILNKNHIAETFNVFTDVAITTSFLGVTLGLLDFLVDGFHLRKEKPKGKWEAAILTFLPPVIFALFYPAGFVLALNYASIFVAILLIILPVLMVFSLERKSKRKNRFFRQCALVTTLLFGVGIILVQLLQNTGLIG